MTTITEIIALLGHACDEAWADCRGFYPAIHGVRMVCSKRRGHSGACESEDGHRWTQHLPPLAPLPPTLAEWAAEWEREHPGEPGPVAEWTSPDGRVRWIVETHFKAGIEITVQVANCRMWRFGSSPGWVAWPSGAAYPLSDWAECMRLMAAADGGGR